VWNLDCVQISMGMAGQNCKITRITEETISHRVRRVTETKINAPERGALIWIMNGGKILLGASLFSVRYLLFFIYILRGY